VREDEPGKSLVANKRRYAILLSMADDEPILSRDDLAEYQRQLSLLSDAGVGAGVSAVLARFPI
jgi:hypothetical protein